MYIFGLTLMLQRLFKSLFQNASDDQNIRYFSLRNQNKSIKKFTDRLFLFYFAIVVFYFITANAICMLKKNYKSTYSK